MNINSTYKILNTKKLFFVSLLILLIVGVGTVSGATRYSVANGNWNATSTWSASSNGTSGASVPASGDDVIIERNRTVTVNGNFTCLSLVVGAASNNPGILTFSGVTPSLTVTGAVQLGGSGNTAKTGTITFTSGSILDAGSVVLGNAGGTPAAGIITMTAGGTLKTGSLTVNTVTGNTWTPGTGTVNMDATNTLPATIFTTFNNLICSAGITTTAVALTIGGNLDVSSGATFATGINFTLGVTGTTNITGTLTLAGTATKTFTGDVTLNSGAVWNETGIATINYAGSLTNNATTFTANTGIHTFSGATKVLSGATANVIPTATFTGNYTNSGTLTVATLLTVTGGAIRLTNNGTVTATTSLAGTGGLTQGVSGILNLGGATTPITTLDAQAVGNTVNYTRVGIQTVDLPVSGIYHNLSFSGGSAKSLSGATTVNGLLTLTSGLLTLGVNSLTLGGSAPAIQVTGTFDATNMIVADGGGELRKIFTAPGSYQFPVGDVSGPGSTPDYSPVTIVFASGTFAGYVGVKVTDAIHPNASVTSYISRYWSISQSGITAFSATITGTFVPGDVVGTLANIISARWITPSWVRYSAATSSTISATSLVAFGDFTGINNLPIINVNPSTLTGFTYVGGLGPSTEQSFTVGGTDLVTNITVLPSASFEISTGTGVSFFPTNPITLNVANGTVPTNTIYVRMKSGLSVGAIAAENIASITTGATTQNVACSGTVVVTPLITISTTTLTGFAYNFGSGPSTAQSFTVSGANLTADIVITPPTDYQICLTVGGTYVSTLTLTQALGIVNATTIYVKLKSGLVVSPYNENISLASTNAITKAVSCNGSVNAPTVAVSKFNLAGFIYTFNAGPSSEQIVTVSGTNLTGNLTVTPPANFNISLTSGTGFAATSINLAPSSGTVAATTIYIRMIAGLAIGTVAPINLTASATGAITQNVACSGQIVNAATSISSNTTLNGFVYTLGNGPSIEQSFTVSATSLTSSITVTPPATNFEISLTSGSGFISNPSTLTIAQTGGIVNAVPVYVRLKAGLPVATYSAQNIIMSSTGATNLNVACSGVVVTSPTIIAGPTGLESLCAGANVTLTSTGTGITNQYWNGPNSFYTTSQNPALGVVSATNNGTYTVIGNALSGVNLLTNGDFESGNTGFGSSYAYVAPSATALSTGGPNGGGEGLYTLTTAAYPFPSSVHSSFSSCVDHSNPGSYQMVINGATNPGIIAWSQSVSVVPNADYQFSYWVQSVYSSNPAQLQLYVNGVPAGQVYTADLGTCTWKQFSYNANAGSSSVMQLALINSNTIAGGNDFALDDMVLQQAFPVSSSVILTVNPTLAVSVNVTASNNPVYTGTVVTFTATPTNGGTTPTYQWMVGGVDQLGATNSTFDYTPTNSQVISCRMTSSYPCTTGNPATAPVTMTVNPRYNFWRGSIDTNWAVLANWTAGYVPAPGDDVEYATLANYGSDAIRDLQVDQNRTIGYLINATASRALIIPAAKGLTVNNTIQTAASPDRIIIKADSVLSNGSLIFHNPLNLPVQATVEMYSKAYISVTASPLKYNWQYFGIPLSSVVAEPTFYGSYLRKWDETGTSISNHWVMQNNASVIVPFYGYELCQPSPTTITFQGALVNSNFSTGQLPYTTTALYPGQHIFANPYTAAIDITHLTFGDGMEKTVYMYNTGTYGIWLSGNGGISNGYFNTPGQYYAIPQSVAGTVGLQGQIPSMQAMLVKAMGAASNATFGINYNSVVALNTYLQRAPGVDVVSTSEKVGTMIEVKGEHGADRMWIFTNPDCTRGFDNGWDGQKMIGSALSPQLFAMETDGNYQVNTVPDMHDTELGFQAGEDLQDTLTFTHQNIEKRYAGVYLVDLIENKTIDITTSGTSYAFVAESTPTPVKRFKIVTRPYEKNAPDSDTQVKIFSSQATVFVQNYSNLNGDCLVYDIAGHYIKKMQFGANGVTAITNSLKPGAYIAMAITANEKVSKRLIVR